MSESLGFLWLFSEHPNETFAFATGTFALLLALRIFSELKEVLDQRQQIDRRLTHGFVEGLLAMATIDVRRQRALEEDGLFKRLSQSLNRLIVQSGLKFRPVLWTAITAALAVGIGGLVHWQLRLIWLTIPVVILVSLFGPVFVLKFCVTRRRKKINSQLIDALQIIVRSLEAGHPISASLQLVAKEMPAPLGQEFVMAADEIAYGISFTQGIDRMAARIGDEDVDLFSATVRLQERTGGNLCELLKNNVATIRDRQTLRLRVVAASAEGRMSATILTAAPFIVAGGIHLMEPDFYGYVIDDPNFRYTMLGFGVWMFIGNMIMKKMIAFDV
ncbi:MAG: type II secretion system F family protein [Pseudomonadota bacterium]